MVFSDIHGKMNHPYTRSRYIHLYINGMYWGLFHTQERPDARSASDYMGGNEEDYDVMKPETNLLIAAEDKKVIATDGNSEAALRLWNMAITGFPDAVSYYKVQGLNTDGSKNPEYERLLDIDNLIDYLNWHFMAMDTILL
ncbi:MAG: CotH kinase family protein [Bacteroidales bacterium]|nr:CotH kinase family protein [Bacteroidales bacterium]